ncbi:hypothetical protein GCM10019016_017770 [Streptomyces prasinosporus]|uniref:Uncharacterized protein n=1 Tax=Streptomyces prasinosporus TaxID=68256 RepID=A0ABP6THH5_9ACTN
MRAGVAFRVPGAEADAASGRRERPDARPSRGDTRRTHCAGGGRDGERAARPARGASYGLVVVRGSITVSMQRPARRAPRPTGPGTGTIGP